MALQRTKRTGNSLFPSLALAALLFSLLVAVLCPLLATAQPHIAYADDNANLVGGNGDGVNQDGTTEGDNGDANEGTGEGEDSDGNDSQGAGTGTDTGNETGNADGTDGEDPASETPEEPEKPDDETVRILFVGNSFTYTGGQGVPNMLSAIAKANGKKVSASRISYSGAALSNYAFENAGIQSRHDALIEKLSSKEWDYVVLQEQSTLGITDPDVEMYGSIQALRDLIAEYQPDAEVLLYATHGFSGKVTVDNTTRLIAASEMQLRVQSAYTAIGDRLNLRVVPVGMYFQRYASVFPYETLLRSDSKHPSAAGFFIAGCAFYETLFGEAPEQTSDKITKLSQDDQARLKSIVGGSASIEPARKTLSVGESTDLNLSTSDPLTFASSLNPLVASVSPTGTLVANNAGTTTICLWTNSGMRATCAVSVENSALQHEKLQFSEKLLVVTSGDKARVPLHISGTLDEYRLSWKSKNTAIATVDEIGNVTGVKPGKTTIVATDAITGASASFQVQVPPHAPTQVAVTKTTARKSGKKIGALMVSWGKSVGATKYKVYRSIGSDPFKLVATTKKTSFTDKGAGVDVLAKYKVAAVAKTGSTTYVSNQSEASNSGIVLSRPSLAAKTRGACIRLSWTTNSMCQGYEVYRATLKGKFKLVKTVKKQGKAAWKDKGAKEGVTYRYKIRSYRSIGGTKFYSFFSPVRKATLKSSGSDIADALAPSTARAMGA